MIRVIAAITLDRCIGYYPNGLHKKGRLPWEPEEAKGDLAHFKEITNKKGIVIMGRKTFDTLDRQPLPNRHNIVISSKAGKEILEGGELFFKDSVQSAMDMCNLVYTQNDGWNINFIGGSRIFAEGMQFADELILTIVPIKAYDRYDTDKLVYFPPITNNLIRKSVSLHPKNPELRIIVYGRLGEGRKNAKRSSE